MLAAEGGWKQGELYKALIAHIGLSDWPPAGPLSPDRGHSEDTHSSEGIRSQQGPQSDHSGAQSV